MSPLYRMNELARKAFQLPYCRTFYASQRLRDGTVSWQFGATPQGVRRAAQRRYAQNSGDRRW